MSSVPCPAPANSPLPAARQGIAGRLWEAARIEFSERGYHGARVQGIARRAGCNVALLYRHWASKKALYVELLRSVYQAHASEVAGLMEQGRGAAAVVAAYLDSHLRDPVGAQIIIREFLDGGPCLSQIIAADPSVAETARRAARVLADGAGDGGATLHPGADATVAVLCIGGLAALIAAAHTSARPFLPEELSADSWRQHAFDLLVNGVAGLAGRTS